GPERTSWTKVQRHAACVHVRYPPQAGFWLTFEAGHQISVAARLIVGDRSLYLAERLRNARFVSIRMLRGKRTSAWPLDVRWPIVRYQEVVMSDLVAIIYPSEQKAEEVRQRLLKLQKEYLITLSDAVIAVKTDAGPVKLSQLFSTTAAGAAT